MDKVTLKYPAITKVVNQEEMMRVNSFMLDLLTTLHPRSIEIVGQTSTTLPYANLSWQPERVIISENHSYEHMLPVWFCTGDQGFGARAALTAVTVNMSGDFRPRDQPMHLPHRIKGRYFRLLQLLEHVCSFASITVVGIGAVSPVRIFLNPEIHFHGPIGPWSTTLPGCNEIDFDTEQENQDAIAESLKQVAIASGFCSADTWLDRVTFCTHQN